MPSSRTTTTQLNDADGILVVSISRPNNRNAFTEELADHLVEDFHAASTNPKVRVVILTGDPKGKCFCAGADLGGNGEQFRQAPQQDVQETYRDGGGRVGLAILQCTKPVIAAINGAAVGVGLTMPCCCDMRVVDQDAKVGFPFVRRGLAAETISSWTLPKLVGMGQAQELVLTGRVFTAKNGPPGLFNYCVPGDQVLVKALELAKEIASNGSPYSLALSRNMLYRGQQLSPEQAHLVESHAILNCSLGPDNMEGIMSFLEKRPAKFSGLDLERLDIGGWSGPRASGKKSKL
jgi:enoyl-CoA hydratase/carnithine racemase